MTGCIFPSLLALSWSWFIFGPLLALAVILFVLFPLGTFVAALFEPVHLRHLRTSSAAEAAAVAGHAAVAEAGSAGYATLGVFTDGDRGFKEGIITLMLSPDRIVLLWVLHHALGGRHRLITRSADGHWLITSSITGLRDLSGLQDEQMLRNAPLAALEECHRQRLAAWGRPAMPWDPRSVAPDILAYERSRVEHMAAAGLARYLHRGYVYRYTLRGAARLTRHSVSELCTTVAENRLTSEQDPKRDYELR
jgi:hypothetical protein